MSSSPPLRRRRRRSDSSDDSSNQIVRITLASTAWEEAADGGASSTILLTLDCEDRRGRRWTEERTEAELAALVARVGGDRTDNATIRLFPKPRPTSLRPGVKSSPARTRTLDRRRKRMSRWLDQLAADTVLTRDRRIAAFLGERSSGQNSSGIANAADAAYSSTAISDATKRAEVVEGRVGHGHGLVPEAEEFKLGRGQGGSRMPNTSNGTPMPMPMSMSMPMPMPMPSSGSNGHSNGNGNVKAVEKGAARLQALKAQRVARGRRAKTRRVEREKQEQTHQASLATRRRTLSVTEATTTTAETMTTAKQAQQAALATRRHTLPVTEATTTTAAAKQGDDDASVSSTSSFEFDDRDRAGRTEGKSRATQAHLPSSLSPRARAAAGGAKESPASSVPTSPGSNGDGRAKRRTRARRISALLRTPPRAHGDELSPVKELRSTPGVLYDTKLQAARLRALDMTPQPPLLPHGGDISAAMNVKAQAKGLLSQLLNGSTVPLSPATSTSTTSAPTVRPPPPRGSSDRLRHYVEEEDDGEGEGKGSAPKQHLSPNRIVAIAAPPTTPPPPSSKSLPSVGQATPGSVSPKSRRSRGRRRAKARAGADGGTSRKDEKDSEHTNMNSDDSSMGGFSDASSITSTGSGHAESEVGVAAYQEMLPRDKSRLKTLLKMRSLQVKAMTSVSRRMRKDALAAKQRRVKQRMRNIFRRNLAEEDEHEAKNTNGDSSSSSSSSSHYPAASPSASPPVGSKTEAQAHHPEAAEAMRRMGRSAAAIALAHSLTPRDAGAAHAPNPSDGDGHASPSSSSSSSSHVHVLAPAHVHAVHARAARVAAQMAQLERFNATMKTGRSAQHVVVRELNDTIAFVKKLERSNLLERLQHKDKDVGKSKSGSTARSTKEGWATRNNVEGELIVTIAGLAVELKERSKRECVSYAKVTATAHGMEELRRSLSEKGHPMSEEQHEAASAVESRRRRMVAAHKDLLSAREKATSLINELNEDEKAKEAESLATTLKKKSSADIVVAEIDEEAGAKRDAAGVLNTLGIDLGQASFLAGLNLLPVVVDASTSGVGPGSSTSSSSCMFEDETAALLKDFLAQHHAGAEEEDTEMDVGGGQKKGGQKKQAREERRRQDAAATRLQALHRGNMERQCVAATMQKLNVVVVGDNDDVEAVKKKGGEIGADDAAW